jgi:hypothetical protein
MDTGDERLEAGVVVMRTEMAMGMRGASSG